MDDQELLMARGWVSCPWDHASEICAICIDGLVPSYDAVIPIAFELAKHHEALAQYGGSFEEDGMPHESLRQIALAIIMRLEKAERADRENQDGRG